jgi:hypothetical protein
LFVLDSLQTKHRFSHKLKGIANDSEEAIELDGGIITLNDSKIGSLGNDSAARSA